MAITKIPVTKSINSELLIEQLKAAYPGLVYDYWLQNDGTLNIVVPDGSDPAPAQTVIANHVSTQVSAAQTLRNQIITTAQTAVGVQLSALTTVQVRALMAIVLYNQGGVSTTLTVKPLENWMAIK